MKKKFRNIFVRPENIEMTDSEDRQIFVVPLGKIAYLTDDAIFLENNVIIIVDSVIESERAKYKLKHEGVKTLYLVDGVSKSRDDYYKSKDTVEEMEKELTRKTMAELTKQLNEFWENRPV